MSNISAGTTTTTSLVQTGDLTGNLLLQSNAVTIATVTSTGVSVTGVVSATGNITALNFIGNGSALTGIASGASSNISNGTSNVVVAASGNVTVGVAGTPNVVVFSNTANVISATGNIGTTGNITANNLSAGNIVVVGGFTITAVGTKLVFSYGGANILSLNSTGNLIASNNVTAFGTP
jgi:hypothetical protein